MVRVDGETQLGPGRAGEALEKLVGCLQGDPATLANEVRMGKGGQLVSGGAVAQMGVDDDPEVLEVVQAPVDGGHVDPGCPFLDGRGQLLGGEVGVGVKKNVEQDAARRRGPPAPGAQRGYHPVNAGHLVRGSRPGPLRLAHFAQRTPQKLLVTVLYCVTFAVGALISQVPVRSYLGGGQPYLARDFGPLEGSAQALAPRKLSSRGTNSAWSWDQNA